MAFLLGVSYQDDGFTRITYDNGPTNRVQLLCPPGASREVLDMEADTLLQASFTEVRPPTVNRRRVR